VRLPRSVDALRLVEGRREIAEMIRRGPYERITDAEVAVFSQFGDDGIIQYLINLVKPLPDSFIEIGVEDYSEANTRFLLMNNNWQGLLMDASAAGLARLRVDPLFWRHALRAERVFVTRENINEVITRSGFKGEIGLLSIDLDGNDYWVWKAINCVQPVIAIVEYNSVFGPDRAITVPYDPEFVRRQAHYSNLYFGASISGLQRLGQRLGYALVGSNSAGNNAYFVRSDRLVQPLRALAGSEAHRESRFRESRDRNGKPTYLDGPARLEPMLGLQVWDVDTQALTTL